MSYDPEFERMKRALTQRLFILVQNRISEECHEYHVLGNSQLAYQVRIQLNQFSCTCPDFKRRIKNCKHLLYVLVKVLRLSDDHPWFQQAPLSSSETEKNAFISFLKTKYRVDGACVANKDLREKYKAQLLTSAKETNKTVSGRHRDLVKSQVDHLNLKATDDQKQDFQDTLECSICFCVMDDQQESLVWCQQSCGKNFHEECINEYERVCSSNYKKMNCPLCRASWVPIQKEYISLVE